MINLSRRYDSTVVPKFYADKHPQFAAVIDAYYTWIDTFDLNTVETNRNIDTVSDQFLDALVDEISSKFPYTSTDKKTIGRFAREVFRARGTRLGTEQLFRLMYDVDAKISYPGDKVFAPSSDQFAVITQIQVTNDSNIDQFINKKLTTPSGGELIVRSVKTTTNNGRRYSMIDVSNVIHPIRIGEPLYPSNACVVGSAGTVSITNSLAPVDKYSVVKIVGNDGGIAFGIVNGVVNQGHELVTNIISGGSGYTTTPEYTVSDTIVVAPSANITSFDIGSTVQQVQYHITPANSEFTIPVGANVSIIQVNNSNTVITTITTPVIATLNSTKAIATLVVAPTNPSANVIASTFITYGSNTVEAVITNNTASGKIVGQQGQQVGIANTNGKFLPNIAITGSTANIIGTSVGEIPSTTVAVTSLGGVFHTLVDGPFDSNFAKYSSQQVVYNGINYRPASVGTIDQIVVSTSSTTLDPIISVTQPMTVSGNTYYTFNVTDGSKFIGGETLIHSSNTNMIAINVGLDVVHFAPGDVVYSSSIISPIFIGIVRSVDSATIYVGDVQGSISTNDTIICRRNSKSVEVIGTSTAYSPQMITGVGRIVSIVDNTITTRISGGVFVDGGNVYGKVSTHSTAISSLITSSVEYRGENFDVVVSNKFGQPLVTSIAITDPGVGFTHNQQCTIYDIYDNVIATGFVISHSVVDHPQKQGLIRSGISQDSYIHDNDYYQTHSYEIKSPLTFDMYSQSIKQFAHVSGTKMFGSVNIEHTFDHTISSESAITETT